MSPNIPATALEMAFALILPLILPTLKNDTEAARALALHMLGEYHPQTVRELRLATEAISFSIKSLIVLAESAEPDIKPEKLDASLKWATSLGRASHQAQRRLTEFQRAARTTPAPEPAIEPVPPAPEPEHETQEAATRDVAVAEANLASATKRLNLMKAHHKGAPPPHSTAAQQIQAQQRVVETARLKLQQARRIQIASPEPEQISA